MVDMKSKGLKELIIGSLAAGALALSAGCIMPPAPRVIHGETVVYQKPVIVRHEVIRPVYPVVYGYSSQTWYFHNGRQVYYERHNDTWQHSREHRDNSGFGPRTHHDFHGRR
jgi:hypothetical protein